MSVILYINAQLVDLEPSQVIAQTKQVNDINSIDDRQANYTNKFKIPKTANNIRIMQFMTLHGNTSNTAYQRNICSLYSDTGECFVYNGWAVVTDTGDSYDAVIYDGIIDLYKDIENKNLSDLNLTELNHTKDVATVIASMYSEYFGIPPYTYILSDYNGKALSDSGNINIDYLVPSVSIKYLWDKIFSTYGYTYSGAVFQSQNFRNLWMTYPKGLENDSEQILFKSNDYDFPSAASQPGLVYYSRFNTSSVNILAGTIQNIFYKVGVTGAYKIQVKGKLFGKIGTANSAPARTARIQVVKNNEGGSSSGNVIDTLLDSIPADSDFDITTSVPYNLNAGDTLTLLFSGGTDNNNFFYLRPQDDNEIELTLSYIQPLDINFGDSLSDFSIRDFLTEVVQRFGLTMFKDKYTKNIRFLTLNEIFQNDVIDWSSKFSRVVNENYIYGTYAQRNNLRYNYNDKESSYNDGYIFVDNKNLPDSKDVVKSKIYSPEKENTIYLGVPHKVYKLWDKEVKEDNTIEYKPLDKRYYFLRRNLIADQPTLKIVSEILNQEGNAAVYNAESYYKLPFDDIVNEYYMPLQNILNKAIITNVDLYLNDNDITNIDFSKLIFIEQLSNYYLINKISNYRKGKTVRVELIRVKYSL